VSLRQASSRLLFRQIGICLAIRRAEREKETSLTETGETKEGEEEERSVCPIVRRSLLPSHRLKNLLPEHHQPGRHSSGRRRNPRRRRKKGREQVGRIVTPDNVEEKGRRSLHQKETAYDERLLSLSHNLLVERDRCTFISHSCLLGKG